MLKEITALRSPDSYYSGKAGFLGCTIEDLRRDMSRLELAGHVPESVRRSHDAVRHAYIYSYYSYDLLTLAAAQTFPCLELALRERLGKQFDGRLDRKGRPRPPPMLAELAETAKNQNVISGDIDWINPMRKMFAHGSDIVVNAPLFLGPFEMVTELITDIFRAPVSV